MSITRLIIAAATAAALSAPAAMADEMIARYVAFIGRDDLYNSSGSRLMEPWQILRQDRANFHRFGVSQPGDDWDPIFQDKNNRAVMENMLRNGRIDPSAAAKVVNGGVMVEVEVFDGGTRDYLRVNVVN